MNAGRYVAVLAAGVVATVASVLSLTYVSDRRAAREHAAYRAGRGR